MTINEYASSHQKAFRAAFDFLAEHFPPENTEEYWNGVVKACGDISARTGEDPLTVQLVSGVVNYLDNVCKEGGTGSG